MGREREGEGDDGVEEREECMKAREMMERRSAGVHPVEIDARCLERESILPLSLASISLSVASISLSRAIISLSPCPCSWDLA